MALNRGISIVMGLAALVIGCGGSNRQDPCTTLRIAGGNECEVRPLSVAAIVSDRGYCSGIFVTKQHVVTAAHCIPEAGSRMLVATQGFSEETTNVQVHPGYSGGLSAFDVAVVTIATDAPVEPVPLLISSYVERGEKVVAFGYGLDENGDDVVERVELGGLPLKATYLDVEGVSPEFIRTISDGGGDTCQGDSGGPILMQGIDDEYGLIAVVSFGPNTCEPNVGFPSANTNLQSASVHDFIVSIAGNVNLN